MIPRCFLPLFLVAVLAWPAMAEDAAKADGPISLKEIGKLRLARHTNEEIIEMIKVRGIDFEMDDKAQATLRSMRFKPEQIELIAKIVDGRYAEELKKEAEAKAKWEAEKPKAPKPGTAPSGVQVGPRISEGAHETIADRAQRIWKASNTDTKFHQTETVTVFASEKSAKIHLPNVKKIEQEVRKKFDEPIKTGTDKRSAVIVLCDTRYDYERWIKAMFAIYEKDGITWTGQDPLGLALKGPAFLTPTMTVVDLSALTEEQQKHNPVFCFGYLYMEQLVEQQAPDAIVTGFGNLCETIVFGNPINRVNSYADREIGGNAEAWATVVRTRLNNKKLSTIDQILRFSTASMESDEYCEAWSLDSFLASTPDLYNRWITTLRDERASKKEKPLESLLRIYGKTEEQLTKEWHAFIKKG